MSVDNDKRSQKDEELDRFWTLEETLPPKKRRGRFSEDTDAVLIELEDKTQPETNEGTTFREVLGYTIPKNGNEKARQTAGRDAYKPIPVLEYVNETSLINKVTVWQWPSKYQFYERFQTDAERYFDRRGYECPRAPFFSYIPQYIQLSKAQYEWYFWWRECVRDGGYPDTDYSYILLYIYEIINLPEKIKPEDGVRLLVSLWLGYRDRYKKLDELLSELVCDYCLINRLSPPAGLIGDRLGEMINSMSLKEFYLSELDITSDKSAYASLLMNLSSNYDWHASRYFTAETADMFRKHMTAAFSYAVRVLSDNNARYFSNTDRFSKARLTRDAYAGSLCAYNVKRRIDVEYRTFTRSIELRLIVTDLVKCVENGVRTLLKVKARLSTPHLEDIHRNAVSAYFAPFKEEQTAKSGTRKANTVPDYEKQYEAESGTLSIENALKLETGSWEVAEVLGEFEDMPTAAEPIKLPGSDTPPTNPAADLKPGPDLSSETNESPDDRVMHGLKLLMENKSTGFAEYAVSLNMFADTLAEQINEALYETVGDIVCEDCGEGYIIIEDYREDISGYLSQYRTEDK